MELTSAKLTCEEIVALRDKVAELHKAVELISKQAERDYANLDKSKILPIDLDYATEMLDLWHRARIHLDDALCDLNALAYEAVERKQWGTYYEILGIRGEHGRGSYETSLP